MRLKSSDQKKHLGVLAGGIAVGVLAERPPEVEAEALEQALVVSPGVAGHEIVGLEIDPVDVARPDVDVVLDALEAGHDLQAGVGLPLEPELVNAVAGVAGAFVEGARAHAAEVVDIAEVEIEVEGDVLVVDRPAGGLRVPESRVIDADLGVLEDVLLDPEDAVIGVAAGVVLADVHFVEGPEDAEPESAGLARDLGRELRVGDAPGVEQADARRRGTRPRLPERSTGCPR